MVKYPQLINPHPVTLVQLDGSLVTITNDYFIAYDGSYLLWLNTRGHYTIAIPNQKGDVKNWRVVAIVTHQYVERFLEMLMESNNV